MFKKKIKLIFLLLLILLLLNCNNKNFPQKRIFKFLNFSNNYNIVYIYYDKKTKKQINKRREAIIRTLKKISKIKYKFVVMKYFISSKNHNEEIRIKNTFRNTKLTNIFLQMANWNKTTFNGSISDITKYMKNNWFEITNFHINSKYLFDIKKYIFPDKYFLSENKKIGHVLAYIKNKNFYNIPLFVKFNKFLIPSLPLLIALKIKKLELKNLKIKNINNNYIIQIKNNKIQLDKFMCIKINIIPPQETFPVISMIDFLNKNINYNFDKNTIIVIGEGIMQPKFNLTNDKIIDSNHIVLYNALSIVENFYK